MSQRLRRERTASPRKSKWRLAGVVIAGILSVVLVFGLLGLLLILHPTPPPVIRTDPAAAKRSQQELQETQTAAAAGTPGVVRADVSRALTVAPSYARCGIVGIDLSASGRI